MASAIDKYEHWMEHDKGNKPKSVTETARRLRAFLRVDEACRPIRLVTPLRARELYDLECARLIGKGPGARPVSPDTHRNTLAETKTFFRWCLKKGWVGTNPFEGIEGRGRRHKGKVQLRVDEARRFAQVALELAAQSHTAEVRAGATAALLTLILGMRASEIVSRLVRDVDDEGRLLWIPESKTKAGRRALEVPEMLRPALLGLAAGREPMDRLFPSSRREWPRKCVQRICKQAKVPAISAHGMRGTHGTMATAMGIAGHAVAASMGHESSRTTMGGSYVTPEAQEQAQRQRALVLLQGGQGARP